MKHKPFEWVLVIVIASVLGWYLPPLTDALCDRWDTLKIGVCHKHAIYNSHRFLREGKKARIGYGEYKGSRHAWAEYYDEKRMQWLIYDSAVKGWHGKNEGWPVEAYKTGDKRDYRVYHYGYPELGER